MDGLSKNNDVRIEDAKRPEQRMWGPGTYDELIREARVKFGGVLEEYGFNPQSLNVHISKTDRRVFVSGHGVLFTLCADPIGDSSSGPMSLQTAMDNIAAKIEEIGSWDRSKLRGDKARRLDKEIQRAKGSIRSYRTQEEEENNRLEVEIRHGGRAEPPCALDGLRGDDGKILTEDVRGKVFISPTVRNNKEMARELEIAMQRGMKNPEWVRSYIFALPDYAWRPAEWDKKAKDMRRWITQEASQPNTIVFVASDPDIPEKKLDKNVVWVTVVREKQSPPAKQAESIPVGPTEKSLKALIMKDLGEQAMQRIHIWTSVVGAPEDIVSISGSYACKYHGSSQPLSGDDPQVQSLMTELWAALQKPMSPNAKILIDVNLNKKKGRIVLQLYMWDRSS